MTKLGFIAPPTSKTESPSKGLFLVKHDSNKTFSCGDMKLRAHVEKETLEITVIENVTLPRISLQHTDLDTHADFVSLSDKISNSILLTKPRLARFNIRPTIYTIYGFVGALGVVGIGFLIHISIKRLNESRPVSIPY